MRVAFYGLALIVATTSAAWAAGETCKADPEPVVMPLADFEKLDVDKGKAATADLFKDIKLYQTANEAFRACLGKEMDAIKAKGDKVSEAEKAAYGKMADEYNASVEREQAIAKSANAMLDSLCARGDKPSCP